MEGFVAHGDSQMEPNEQPSLVSCAAQAAGNPGAHHQLYRGVAHGFADLGHLLGNLCGQKMGFIQLPQFWRWEKKERKI